MDSYEFLKSQRERIERENPTYTQADLDTAKAESAAAAFQQCAEILQFEAERDRGFGAEHNLIRAVGYDYLISLILATSPDPDFAERIRDEVWDEAIQIAEQHRYWGGFLNNAVVDALKAAKRGGQQNA